MFEPNAISSREQTLFLCRCGECRTFFTSAFSKADLCRECVDGMHRAHERARQIERARGASLWSEVHEDIAHREAIAEEAHEKGVCPVDCDWCNYAEYKS